MKASNRSWFRRLIAGSLSKEMVSLMSPEYETVMRVPLRILPAAVIISPAGWLRTLRPNSLGDMPGPPSDRTPAAAPRWPW